MFKTRNACPLLFGLCVLVYLNSLEGAFISDDIPAIVKNPQIIHPLNFWMEPASLLNSLNYRIAGYNPFIYHLTSILLHSLNAILVFFFIRLFFGVEASLLGSILFAVHPIHTEAVAWISGKPYLLFSAFILANALLYQRVAENKGRFRVAAYLLSLAIFYYMTLRYYIYYLFPLLLILLDITLERWRKSWRLWIPFFLLAVLNFAAARVALSNRISFMHNQGAAALKNHIYAVYSFYAHLWLLFWPRTLPLFLEVEAIPAPIFKYGLLYLIPPAIFLILAFRKAKVLFLALGFFIIFLAPTYSPIPFAALTAERYLYLPSIALSIMLAFLYQRYGSQYTGLRKYLLFTLAIIITVYGARTVIRNEVWRTPESFWSEAAAIYKNSWQAHSNLGFVYLTQERPEEAIREYARAIQLNPESADLYNNLGVAYNKIGKAEEARHNFQKAVGVDPDFAPAHFNLAIIYCRQGKYRLAIEHSDKAGRLGYKNIPQELLEKLKPYRK